VLAGGLELLPRRFELLPQCVGILTRLVIFLARRYQFPSSAFKFGPKVTPLLPERLELLTKTVTLLTDSFDFLARPVQFALTLIALGAEAFPLAVDLVLRPFALVIQDLLELLPDPGGRLCGGLLRLDAQAHGVSHHAAFRFGACGRNFGLETRRPLGPDLVDPAGPSLFGLGFSRPAGTFELIVMARAQVREL
jgi:hypothetical protein